MLLCGLHPHVLELAWQEITGATFTTCGLNPKFGHVSEARRPLRGKPVSLNFPPAPGPGKRNERVRQAHLPNTLPSCPYPLLLVALTIDLALKLRQRRHNR